MSDWNFPSNGGGQVRGIADAGILTFTGKEISSLARETCQNSLDVVADEIPACDKYRNISRRCRDFWSDTDKARKFFDAAIRHINRPKISVLRINDFNTTGLVEPFNPDAHTGWNTLTKIDGGATKTGDSAGSFGIGKNAPFTNSYLRMIFYRTLNLDGERAAQGTSRIVSFKLDNENISAGGSDNSDTRRTTGDENPDGRDIILNPVGKSVTCDKVRVIKVGDKKYRLIVRVDRKISCGYSRAANRRHAHG